MRFGGCFEKLHASFLRRAAPFTNITPKTSANDVVPRRRSATTAWDDVIEAEVMSPKFLSAILAPILVSQENIPAVELDHVARNTVVIQQPDDARNLDREGDGAYPIIPFADIFESGFGLAQFQPTLKVEGQVLTIFDMHDLGLSFIEQRKSALHIDNVDGGVGSIESQHTGLHRRRWT